LKGTLVVQVTRQGFDAKTLTLVDGYKFDIGIYTMITSIDPLRIYIYNGDALLRFCPQKYYPFDPSDRDKYVVHDDYRPTWEVPTLARLYSDLGFTFKETLNAHIRSLGKDPQKIWNDIEDVIRFFPSSSRVCLQTF
jgi:tubulin monoglycylase TTLL15